MIVKRWNKRKKTIAIIVISAFLLLLIIVSGLFVNPDKLTINLQQKNGLPSFKHIFGTDWLGRDMLVRTRQGLLVSMFIGLLAAMLSSVIALILSLLATWHKWLDYIVTWLVDLFLSVPHLVILILISFAIGGGVKGVIFSLGLTHWPSLTRVFRAEILQLKNQDYVKTSRQLGKRSVWIGWNHFLPHLLPQMLIGFLLLFPHTILHEAAITFLGFGLSSELPAIGLILSESMRYLSTGMWWLAFFPGLSLLIMVGLFDLFGQQVRKFIDPFEGH